MYIITTLTYSPFTGGFSKCNLQVWGEGGSLRNVTQACRSYVFWHFFWVVGGAGGNGLEEEKEKGPKKETPKQIHTKYVLFGVEKGAVVGDVALPCDTC